MIPGLGRSPGEGKGYPLQYSGLENSMACEELDTTEQLSSLHTGDVGLIPESGRSFGEEVKSLIHVQLFATPWTVAQQAPLSMGFPRQEYWSGLLFSPPGDLPDPGSEHKSFVCVSCIGMQILYH